MHFSTLTRDFSADNKEIGLFQGRLSKEDFIFIMNFWLYSTVFAQNAAPKGPSLFENLVPFVFIFLAFYFVLIRPQRKRMKAQKEFLSKLKKGDSVLTSGGVFGTIQGLTEQFVTLEIAEKVQIRILKSQIASYFKEKTHSHPSGQNRLR